MQSSAVTSVPDALLATVVDSFSDMAFVDIVPAEPGELEISHLLHISFSGPDEGSLVLHLPQNCKRRIVENIYGEDWERLQSIEIDDCLLELLNVIAGNFLHVRYGADVTCDISLPKLLFDTSGLQGMEFSEHYFDAEGDLFMIAHRDNRQTNQEECYESER